jgi:hypothetical protein
MNRKSAAYMMIWAGILVCLFAGSQVFAEAPPVEVSLSLDKNVYLPGEPIGVLRVTVTNRGGDLLIRRGFQAQDYFLSMRVIDPAGRLLQTTVERFHDEFPDAPPYGYVRIGERVIQAKGCELMSADSEIQKELADLRALYKLELPGYYSIQVQLPATIWLPDSEGVDPNSGYCDGNAYNWRVVLKSNTVYFSVLGATEGVKVAPDQWSTKWITADDKEYEVQGHIYPEEGKSTTDYEPSSVRLNGVYAKKVQILKPMLQAHFDGKEVIQRLGSVQVGQSYTVTICVEYKGVRGTLCRQQKIRIVN